MNSKIGLTLGKFAPLHKGHQYMIETAISEMDHVIVVVYDASEVTSIPLDVRANWIKTLYPSVEVIEGYNSPNDMGDTPEIKKIQEDYIQRVLNGRKITHFYSSEFYGDHMSKSLNVVNRELDRGRTEFSISGTIIRNSPYQHKRFLSPVVYKDFVTNIVFVGAPSTGKTTIAQELSKRYNTEWMPEYGREYWEKNQVNRRLTIDQLLEIAEGHIEQEEKLIFEANNYLFTDTNAITTYMFSLYYHGSAHPKLVKLAKKAEKRYDLVFLCDTDIPYDDTWDRSGEMNRQYFQEKIIQDLRSRKLPYFILSGDLEQRIKVVDHILKSYRKFDN